MSGAIDTILNHLHRFARETGAPAGADVVEWFDRAVEERNRLEAEKRLKR